MNIDCQKTIIELNNISKTFGNFKANDNINFSIYKGEVHAILGENGAGKSTLVKTLFGHHRPDPGGEIILRGQKVNFPSPQAAIKSRIGMVYQHFRLVPPLTLLENIILGQEPTLKNFGNLFIDYQKAKFEIQEIINRYHFELDLDLKVEESNIGTGQKVEIIKTLYRKAEIIIFDEPTAVLTPQEILDFYQIVRNLKREGKTIILITHKLGEIKAIADRCTILRRGKYIETLNVQTSSEEILAEKMVGKKMNLKILRTPPTKSEDIVLRISNLCVLNTKNNPAIKQLSLSVKKGEILGIAGISGNGQNELVDALTGLLPIKSGKIELNQKEIQGLTPKDIYQNKLHSIPEDRQRRGLVLDYTVGENLVLQNISNPPFSKYGCIINKKIEQFAHELIARFDIRPPRWDIPVAHLSGGNQQKVILAREISNGPSALIAFQPTRGLDVGAISEVHQELLKLKSENCAILLISYELDEILSLSDRVAVLFQGTITQEFANETLTQESLTSTDIKSSIGLAMAGGGRSL